MSTYESLVWVANGPVAWHMWLDVDHPTTVAGIRDATVHLSTDLVVAVAVERVPKQADAWPVGLIWEPDHTNALVEPESYFNETSNCWFVGVYPRGERPTDADIDSTAEHIRRMLWIHITQGQQVAS